jgi:peptidoglycan/LPS O-acetylase OafA/YrhL
LSVVFLHFRDMFFPWDHASLLTHRQKILLAVTAPFSAAHPAVLLFFAISGFVLALPYLRGRQQPYRVFVGRRVLRIYGPYLVALAFAVAGDAIWHGHLGLGDWADAIWSQPVSARLVLQHVLFIGNYNWGQINPVYWSLVYEMRISLLFPLLFAFVDRVDARVSLVVALACPFFHRVIVHVFPASETTAITLNYIAIFMCGILIAKHRATLGRWYQALSRPMRFGLALTMFVLYTFGNLLPHFAEFAECLGALGYLILTLNSTFARRMLNQTVPIYLGRISYSLYLVHAPVLFAMAFTLLGRIGLPLFFGIYVVLAILFGSAFHVLVEKPFINLSRRVGVRSALPAVEQVA